MQSAQGGPPCPTKPCHPTLLVHPCHSHTYIRSSSCYVHIGPDVQTSCVHCHPLGNMLTPPLSWSGGWGFFGSPAALFMGVMSCCGTAWSQLGQMWGSAEWG